MDEARVGQKDRTGHRWWIKGQRPPGLADKRFASAYIFAAVRPATGEDFAFVLPRVSTAAMSRFLADFAASLRGGHPRCPGARPSRVARGQGAQGARDRHARAAAALLTGPQPGRARLARLRERDLSHRLLADHEAVVDASCAAWN